MKTLTGFKTNKKLKQKLAVSAAILLLLAAVSMVGVTQAWFVSESASFEKEFSAGTVELSEPSPEVLSITEVTAEDYTSISQELVVSEDSNNDPAENVYKNNDEHGLADIEKIILPPQEKCVKVEWKISNIGTKEVYVRVKPEALDSESIKIIPGYSNTWTSGNGGWWYSGISSPTVINPNSTVAIGFDYCFSYYEDLNQVEVYLLAEAVQASNNAVDNIWHSPSHPWLP